MPSVALGRQDKLRNVQDALVQIVDVSHTATGFLVSGSSSRLVVTAAHAVDAQAPRTTVLQAGRSFQLDIIRRDVPSDVALLADRPELHGAPLVLHDDDVNVGDEVWLAGFPRGWNDTTPVFARGIIAGAGQATWLQIDASWGQSGGPVFVLTDDGPRVIGVVRSAGASVQQSLEDLIAELKRNARDYWDMANDPTRGRGSVGGLDPHRLATDMASILSRLGELVGEHFRSGYVRIATLREMRSLL